MKKCLLNAALLLSAGTICVQAQVTNIMQGLVSYWPMDTTYSSNGNTYTPDVIQGNDLWVTTNGGGTPAVFVPGKFGNCVSNTGSSFEIYTVTNWTVNPGAFTNTSGSGPITNYIPTASATGLPIEMNPTTNFTVSLWVWAHVTDNGVSTGNCLYSESTTNTNTAAGSAIVFNDIRVSNPGSNTIQLINRDISAYGAATNGTNYTSAQKGSGTESGTVVFPTTGTPSWHHVVWLCSGTTYNLYVDGTNVSAGTESIVVPLDSIDYINQMANVTIGGLVRAGVTTNGTIGSLFHGMEDDVAVWNRALSPTEIANLFNSSTGLGGGSNLVVLPPYFTSAPVGGSVPACGNFTMSSSVAVPSSTPPSPAGFSYQWQQDGTNVTAGEFSGQTTTSLTITGAQAVDTGTYTLIASFYYATNTSVLVSVTNAPAVLTVVTTPTFTSTAVGTTNLWPGDNWNLSFGVNTPCGGATYQWLQNSSTMLQDGGDISGSGSTNLVFTGIDITNSGTYNLIVYYNGGASSVTSAPVVINVNPWNSFGESTPSLTNGLIAYWPLYPLSSPKTPDLVNGYDMTVVGAVTNATDHTGGTNAMYLNGSAQYCYRIDGSNDLIPALNYPAYSIAFWVQAQGGTTSENYGNGAFGMADTYGGAFLTLFGNTYLGNASQAQYLRPFYRIAGGGGSGYDVFFSDNPVYDGSWHHVVYIQRPFGTNYPGLNPVANPSINTANVLCQMYRDGILDPVSFFEIWPLTNAAEPRLNTDCIGSDVRSVGVGSTMTGAISDVAEWNRVLSPAEVMQLYSSGMPAITPNIPLMSIASFTADAPEIAQGGAVTLYWNTSAYATAISINQGVGSVLSNTTAGIGSVTLSNLQQTKTYTLTVSRGTNVVTQPLTVGVLSGLNPGWKPLDTFDEYTPGAFNGVPFWSPPNPTYCEVMPSCIPWPSWTDITGCYPTDQLLHLGGTTAEEPEIKFNLAGNTVMISNTVTLFFRIVTGNDLMDPTETTVVTPVDYVIGLSDWSGIRFYGDSTTDSGPNVYLGTDSGVFAIGGKNGYNPSGVGVNWFSASNATWADSTPLVLSNNAVYDIWLDVTNSDITQSTPQYSVWIAPENNLSNQVEVIANYYADRSSTPPNGSDHPQEIQNMSVVFMGGGSDDASGNPQVLLDDFYISTNGYLHTVPRPAGLTTEQGVPPAVAISSVVDTNGNVWLYWSGGTLASAPALTGPWTPLPGGNTNVPYYVAPPTNAQLFFRTQ